MRREDIKVHVTLTEGYERRFTEACLKVAQRREEKPKAAILKPPEPVRAAVV